MTAIYQKVLQNIITNSDAVIHGAYQKDLLNRATLEGMKGLHSKALVEWSVQIMRLYCPLDEVIITTSEFGNIIAFMWKAELEDSLVTLWTLCGSLPDVQQEPRWFKIRKHNSVRMVAQFTAEIKKCWVLRDARSQQRCSQAGFEQ